MFGPRYFPERFFAPRYWPVGGGAEPTSGRKEYTMQFSVAQHTLEKAIPDYTLPLTLPEATTGEE